MLASGYHQIMKIIPLPNNENGNVTIDFEKEEFLPIIKSNIQDIEFHIRTVDGELISPLNKNMIVYLSLVFKK